MNVMLTIECPFSQETLYMSSSITTAPAQTRSITVALQSVKCVGSFIILRRPVEFRKELNLQLFVLPEFCWFILNPPKV